MKSLYEQLKEADEDIRKIDPEVWKDDNPTFGVSVEEWRKQDEEQRKRISKMGTWPLKEYSG